MNTGIYLITNNITGECYVGSTTDAFRRRWKNHRNELRKNKHHNWRLQRSYNKHGLDSFSFDRGEPAASRQTLVERLGGFLAGFSQNLASVVVLWYTINIEINRCKDELWSTSATNIGFT